MSKEKTTFNEWFDLFVEHCHSLNYHGPIDKETFRLAYEDEKDPYTEAVEFVDEMNDD